MESQRLQKPHQSAKGKAESRATSHSRDLSRPKAEATTSQLSAPVSALPWSFADTPILAPGQPASNPGDQGRPVLRRSAIDATQPGEKPYPLQRREEADAPVTSEAPAIVHEVLRSPGQSLGDAPRRFMESRFGHDFSRVRVYNDDRAAQSAAAVHARAYTIGNSVVFGRDQYSPNTARGTRLLAHELSHVVQQSGPTLPATSLVMGQRGDRFEQQAEQAARSISFGARPNVQATANQSPSLQKDDVANINDFETTDILPTQAVADPDYIGNQVTDAILRSNGSVMSPVFTGLMVYFANGEIMDIPAAANSAFPSFAEPTDPVMTIYRRHKLSGRIFPITLSVADLMAAPGTTTGEKETAALAAHAQFLFRQSTTPNILTVYTNAVARVAFAYSGLLAQIWSLAMGVRGAIQIFSMAGAMRAMAAGRAAAGLGGAAARGAAGQTAQVVLTPIRTQVLKTATLAAAEQAQVQAVETRLISVVQRAIQNVNAGTATGPWAQRLANLPATSPLYRATLGNAIHEESFNLIQQEVGNGALPAGIQTNVGRAIPTAGLTNAYGRLRPDIRLPLSGGNEAVWDITTVAQAGHAQPYTTFSFVQYVVELLYP